MAWSTENWIQDDTKLSGYPTPAGTAYPEEFSLDGLTSIWHKATSHGYFIPSEDITPFSIDGFNSVWHKASSHGYFIPSEDIPAFSIDGFDSIWLFNKNFDGYPHPAEFPASPLPQKPVKQNEYICIFPSNTHQYDENLQSNFDTNGMAILCPTKCEVIEELNGGYSLTMEHPIDENGIWRNIQLFNILKVQGQLFTIINAEPTYTGSSGKINVYAEHIFYKQNDQWIPPKIENSGGGWDDVYIHRENVYYALMSILDVCFPKEGGEDYFPSFWFWSDVETGARHAEKIETGKTRIDEIFTLISDYGGELWRDNFAYTIEKRMRNAIDNAFDIRVGLNMRGIKRSVDTSNFCTHFGGWDNYGNYVGVSYDSATLPAPNVISRTQNFTYDSEDEYHAMDLLMQDVSTYFSKNFAPKITYTINLKDVRNNPDYEEYSGIRYKVGDTGKIYDERLGGELTLKITKTKTNGITGEVTEATFGTVSGFIHESNTTPVPKFPIVPEPEPDPPEPDPDYEQDKISVIILDENMNDEKIVYQPQTITDAGNYLRNLASLSRFYKCVIGSQTGTTMIFKDCFADCKTLYAVEMPETIETIYANAFSGCSALEKIEIPHSVKTIKDYIFRDCTSLKQMALPASIEAGQNTCIGVFSGCTSLQTVKIDALLYEIGNYFFSGCSSLEHVDMPDEMIYIGSSAFLNCTSLKEITIPSTVTAINGYAFNGCTGIKITIKKSTDSIYGAPWSATNATVVWSG